MISEDAVLATLRRVPDRIILAVMGRDLELNNNAQCLCGWFLREKIAELRNVGASAVAMPTEQRGWFAGCDIDSHEGCAKQFGGAITEWATIWNGVASSSAMPIIEAAFVTRVDEACTPKRRTRKAS